MSATTKYELSIDDFLVIIASLKVAHEHLRETARVLRLQGLDAIEVERHNARCLHLIKLFDYAESCVLETEETEE